VAATFKYYDSGGGSHTQDFEVLYVKGFNDPDKVRFFPPLIFTFIDGTKKTAFIGFQRIITIALTSLNSNEDFIRAFLQASSKSITYQGSSISAEEVNVIFESNEYENEWIDGFQKAKRYVIEICEQTIRTIFPTPVNLAIPETDMYYKADVTIIGTSDSPETFTTNIGKLATCDAPSGVYPTFDLSVQKYEISFLSKQDCQFYLTSPMSVSGGNLVFSVARSDSYNGTPTVFKADITIKAQNI